VHDLHALRRVSTPAVADNGAIAYSLRQWDETTDITTTHLKVYLPSGSNSTQLTFKKGSSDFNPTFSSDGATVAFLSTRSGSSQIWTVSTSIGESSVTQFSNYPVDISNLVWVYSDAGDFLVFSAEVYVDCPTLQCTADRDAKIAARGSNTGFVFTQLYVRHWDQYETGKISHLFIQRIMRNGTSWSASGAPVDIMFGMKARSPTPPSGGTEQFAISPNGKEIAFTAEMYSSDEAWTTGWRVYTVDISGSMPGQPQCITTYTKARTQNPVYSPDGSTIAYLAMDRPGFEADRLHICLYNRGNQQMTLLANSWDRSPGTLVWSTDGSTLFADADENGRHKLFAVDVSSGVVTALIEDGNNDGVVTVPNSNLVILSRNSMKAPADLWSFTFSGGSVQNLTPLTQENQALLTNVDMSSYFSFHFTSVNNSKVQGWLVLPYKWKANGRYPLAHLIHGGPQGAWTDDWSYRWNPQLWAAHGYAVVMINPHGSTGFGQAFTDAVSKHWGGIPYQDLMNGLSAILSNYTWINSGAVCAAGASYGGYMINWINGQTDRYKCLVSHDGLFDTRGGYFSTDELWFNEWEFGGLPWNNPIGFDKYNPLLYVAQMKTPTLVVHGGRDYRLPLEHGLSMFTALQRRSIPSRLLYFPEENHWVVRPQNSIIWYNEVLTWLDKWTSNSPPSRVL